MNCKIVVTSSMTLMGDLQLHHVAEGVGQKVLVKPRSLQLLRGPQGQVGIQLQELLGSPPQVELGSWIFMYTPSPEIIKVYSEAVSGIALLAPLLTDLSRLGKN